MFGLLSNIRRGTTPPRRRPVLQGVTFEVKKGEMFGIIGSNGAGKSTLLRLIARTIRPDTGIISTQGKTVPMLELGTGFDYEMSAVENIITYGTILGFRKNQIQEKVEDILKFAELESFANEKIKAFSTGMISRLAFSTASQIEPDILLIDEILSVGDIRFQKKSYQKFLEFKEKGKTIVFVSHNPTVMKQLCNRAMLINNGKAIAIGDPDMVIEQYVDAMQHISPPLDSGKITKQDGTIDIQKIGQLVNQREFAKALGYLRQMYESGGASTGQFNYLYGYCLHNLKIDFEQAYQQYTEALDAGYDEFLVRYARGSLLYEMGDYEMARSDLVRASSINPAHSGPQWVLEQIFASENK